MKVKSESEVSESCPTLSNPMDCSPPGSSIDGIFQARVLEWGAIAFFVYAEYIMRNAGLDKAQAGIKFARKISVTSDMQMTPLLWQKAKRTKELLDVGKREEAKGCLKNERSKNQDYGIWPHYFITNRWETMETVRGFLYLGPKSLQMAIAAMKLKDACSLEEKI